MHNKQLSFSQQTAAYPKLNMEMFVPYFYPQAHLNLVGVHLFPLYLYVLQSCIFFYTPDIYIGAREESESTKAAGMT